LNFLKATFFYDQFIEIEVNSDVCTLEKRKNAKKIQKKIWALKG